jgi:hypothetical protein
MIEYDEGRYALAVTLDGVSESSSADKKTVSIGRKLGWDLSRYCREKNPATMDQFDEWFASTVTNSEYDKMGSTTVAMARFDAQTGAIDGMNIGDSYVLMATERDGKCEVQVLAPLHCVSNDPGIIYKGWRFGHQFEPVIFEGQAPEHWTNLYLITMSDGFQKILDEIQERIIDFNEAEDILARRFPVFARVYLPEPLRGDWPDLRVDRDGRIPYHEATQRPELMEAIGKYHSPASDDELTELLTVRLDCSQIRRLMLNSRGPGEDAVKARKFIQASHPTLGWTFEARYAENLDEWGLEETLRQYVTAELFVRGMLEEMYPDPTDTSNMQHRLRNFINSLGPIADDFSVSMMRILRDTGRRPPPSDPAATEHP